MSKLGWVRRFHRQAVARPPALIFPHAGSGASAYRGVSKELSQYFDVAVVQYPGRQDRASEPPAATIAELAQGALESYCSETGSGETVTVLGHSMGAIVAFEFVRLAEQRGLAVRLLAPSAAVAPARVAQLPPHPSDESELIGHLMALGGTGAGVLDSPELLKLAVPVLRMDYRAFDAYSCGPDVRVAAPIHVLGGETDPVISPAELYGWQRHTTGSVAVTVFAGDHFYLFAQAQDMARLLAGSALSRPAVVGA